MILEIFNEFMVTELFLQIVLFVFFFIIFLLLWLVVRRDAEIESLNINMNYLRTRVRYGGSSLISIEGIADYREDRSKRGTFTNCFYCNGEILVDGEEYDFVKDLEDTVHCDGCLSRAQHNLCG